MIRNLVTFVMTPYREAAAQCYRSQDGFSADCAQTNETALKYLDWKLQQKQEQIDAVYAFVSDKAQEGFQQFCNIFTDTSYPIKDVPLTDNGKLSGALPSIAKMFDFVQEYVQQHKEDTIRMHVDMTGGPRHASMIMIALLQMLQYQGIETGMVIYSDFGAKTVEDATDLMQLYTLISGAEEFTSYGDTEQLQRYFSRQENISVPLKSLLYQMENVSETIRVCGSYETMEMQLELLEKAIVQYEAAMTDNETASEQDGIFYKLLPQIKKEYQSILPEAPQKINPADIITWCANREFLQQALTFYTEWLPRYLVQEHFINIDDPQIVETCKRSGNLWSSWEIYFLKNYLPNTWDLEEIRNTKGPLSGKQINYVVRLYCDQEIKPREFVSYVSGKNEKMDVLLKEMSHIEKRLTNSPFMNSHIFQKLPHENLAYQVVCAACPPKQQLDAFIRSRFSKERSFKNIIFKAMLAVPKDKLAELLALDGAYDSNRKPKEELAQQRADVFKWLFQHKKITSPFSADQVCEFVKTYTYSVDMWRNTFNHASSVDANKETNDQIRDAIIQSIAFLTHADKEKG